MAIVPKWLPWSFLTKTALVATNTSFLLAAPYTSESMPFKVEATGRVIKSAWLDISFDTAHAVATDIDGIEVGIAFNGGAATLVQYVPVMANFGENEALHMKHDVTAELIAGLVAGDAQAAVYTIEVVTGAASSFNNITCTLNIDYEFSNAAATQYAMCDFVLQSHHSTISNVFVETGTTAGIANAPVNQIPQLTGAAGRLLTDGERATGFAGIEQIKAHLTARVGDNSATDQALVVTTDGGATTSVRATIEMGLIGRHDYYDIVDLNGLELTLVTTAAAAFQAANSTVAAGFESIGGFVRAIYSFTAASAQCELHSLKIAGNNETDSSAGSSALAGDETRYAFELNIQEPGPIVMGGNTGFLVSAYNATNQNADNCYRAAGQPRRVYNSANVSGWGRRYHWHRADHNLSTWAFHRGRQRVYADVNCQAAHSSPGLMAIVNYYAGIPAGGVGTGNTTLGFLLAESVESSAVTPFPNVLSAPSVLPSIAHATWEISNLCIEACPRFVNDNLIFTVGAERASNELHGYGWYADCAVINGPAVSENQTGTLLIDATRWIRRRSFDITGRMDVEQTRRWKFQYGVSHVISAVQWVTCHGISYNLTGTYEIDGAAVVSGVDVVDIEARNEFTGETEIVAFDLETDVAGAFSFAVTDNTLLYRAVGKGATPGASAWGYVSPSTDTPKIVGRGASASSTTTITPPVPPHQRFDRLYAIFESHTGEAVTMPAGWTQIGDSPQNAGGTRQTIFESDPATDFGSIAAPLTNDPGDHILTPGILCVRGAHRTGSAVDVTAGGTAASGAPVSIPGDVTTLASELVIASVADDVDSGPPHIADSTWANASLLEFRPIASDATGVGAGGGSAAAAGVKRLAGAYVNTTATLGVAATQALNSWAIKPHIPAAGDFDIEAFTGGGGGGDTTPPTITIISPTPGVLPGAPGGFSADWEVARNTPIVLRVTDAAPGNLYQCIVMRYPGGDDIVIYRRGAFRGQFLARSFVVTAVPLEISVLPASGWASGAALADVTFDVDAIDGDGNLAV